MHLYRNGRQHHFSIFPHLFCACELYECVDEGGEDLSYFPIEKQCIVSSKHCRHEIYSKSELDAVGNRGKVSYVVTAGKLILRILT